jgi:hypothetical protein
MDHRELETQLIISEKLGYGKITEVLELLTVVKQLILGLIKYLKRKRET